MVDFRIGFQKQVGCITKINQINDCQNNLFLESIHSSFPPGFVILVEVNLVAPVYLEKEANIPNFAHVILFEGKEILARGTVVDILD
jgi:translation elongation factor EF-1alpha